MQQNYPNPFNPTTTISYRLTANSFATLKVYDQLGSEVAILVDGVEQPGDKFVLYDASRLASGMYFYVLESEKRRDIKKLLLLK